jgi:hypothetical protein
MNRKRGFGFWVLIIIAILLNLIYLVGQTGSLIDYDFTVSIGLQDSIEEVTGVGVAWAKGFAFGDTVFYMPLFIVGIAGLFKQKVWGIFSMFGALAVTVYWPIVCLYAVFADKNAMNLNPDKYISFSIWLPLIAIYGLWGMWFIY